MDPNQLIKQMIAFNQAVSDNNFRAFTAAHEQTERMVKQIFEKSPLFPEEGKKAVADWMRAYKKYCDDFKSRVDHNFREAENYFGNPKPTDKQP
jgi:polyhydroxyalkanoate synthesis regulator phasin